jgi:hypothetical protein
MYAPFFVQAAVSAGRQWTFRCLVGSHLVILAATVWAVSFASATQAAVFPGHVLLSAGGVLPGHVLLSAGIVEGALLVGWRLTQLPKSQALEFLLVSPLRPPRVLLAEALVGISLLGFVTLAGLPVLLLLALDGQLHHFDVVPLLVMPFTWGTVTGLGLTAWAYEPAGVRRGAERVMLALVILYLLVGVLAGEHLRSWLAWLPEDCGGWLLAAFEAVHRYNPFAVLQFGMQADPASAWPCHLWVELAGVGSAALVLARAARRLQPHFQEQHYRPAVESRRGGRGRIGTRPLSLWAVRRVTEYSGRINLWLAGGFGVLYALYTIAGSWWPSWLGREVFRVFDDMGGIPVLATALVVLAAVPAAFQYGLWDSNAQDRCRRLELLLLTDLNARDYWDAATAAAWRRGRGYFAVAGLLWAAAVAAGQIGLAQALVALAAGVVMWGLYFSLGFRAFARGVQANARGLMLTLGLPCLAYLAYQCGWPSLGALAPPGSVFQATVVPPSASWLPGPLLGAAAALGLARLSFLRCDGELRGWYDRHHGRRVVD